MSAMQCPPLPYLRETFGIPVITEYDPPETVQAKRADANARILELFDQLPTSVKEEIFITYGNSTRFFDSGEEVILRTEYLRNIALLFPDPDFKLANKTRISQIEDVARDTLKYFKDSRERGDKILCGEKRFTCVPREIECLKDRLHTLGMFGSIRTLPPEFYSLKRIIFLNLAGTQIPCVPDDIKKLKDEFPNLSQLVLPNRLIVIFSSEGEAMELKFPLYTKKKVCSDGTVLYTLPNGEKWKYSIPQEVERGANEQTESSEVTFLVSAQCTFTPSPEGQFFLVSE